MVTILRKLTIKLNLNGLLAIMFTEVFIIANIIFAIAFPNPTALQSLIFRIVLSLLVALISGTIISGFIIVEAPPLLRIAASVTGMVIVLILLYLLNPASFSELRALTLALSQRQRTSAFAPAGPDERLIVIAKFKDRSPGGLFSNVDPAAKIYEIVVLAGQDAAIRVEQFPATVMTPEAAREIADLYQASLVIWGWYDWSGIQPYIEFGPRSGLDFSADIDIPPPLAFFPLEQAATRASYLAWLSLGLAYTDVGIANHLQKAIGYFQVAAQRYGGWEAVIWGANCFAWLGEYEVALADYDRALALNPAVAMVYNNRGVVNDRLGDYEASMADYTQAIAINSQYERAYFNRAQARSKQGDLEGAVADYTQALRINPEYVFAYINRGNAYGALENYQAAIENYTQAIALNPADSLVFLNRGNAYGVLGDYQSAIDDYTQAITLNPADALGYIHRGNAYGALPDYQAAINDYTEAIALSAANDLAYVNRGNAYAALQDYPSAIDDYTQAITLNPADALVYIHRGNAYAALQEYQAAIDDYSQALALNPLDGLTYLRRGNAYGILQDYQAAVGDYTHALVFYPGNITIYLSRGNAYGAMQNYQAAINDYTQALALDPDSALIYVSRGNAYGAIQAYQAALDDYTRAITLDPDYALAYVNRGTIYKTLWHLGQPTREKAMTDFEQALKHISDPLWRQNIEDELVLLEFP